MKYYDARAKIARAMSHASRLMILDLLREKEKCVNELSKAVGVNQSTVSKHLTLLKHAGLVSMHREGAMNYYRLARRSNVHSILDSLNSIFQANLKESKAAMK